jgi:hypothetical protein
VGNACEPITDSRASRSASSEPGLAVNTTSYLGEVLGGENLTVERERADERVDEVLQRSGAARHLVALP